MTRPAPEDMRKYLKRELTRAAEIVADSVGKPDTSLVRLAKAALRSWGVE